MQSGTTSTKHGSPRNLKAKWLQISWKQAPCSTTSQHQKWPHRQHHAAHCIAKQAGRDFEGPSLLTGPPAFHIQTRLAGGRPSIIVDPGSVGNLCGDKWAKEVAKLAARNGHRPTYEKRPRPLKVSGVGNGSQECHYDCTLPVALQQANQGQTCVGNITVPAVHNSDLPGLLGLTALRKNRAVLDFNTLRLHFCGPGECELERALPPGTDSFQLELAPSGHIVLPCCEYQVGSTSTEHSLTLISRTAGSSGSRMAEAAAIPPPPPPAPPLLPSTARQPEVIPEPPAANM